MEGFPDLPPVWAFVIAVLAIVLAGVVPLVSLETPDALSWLLIGLGFVLILWSAVYFLLKKTSIEPHHAPKALIVEGPYRVSRNPIYLGMFLGVLGIAFWTNALVAVLVVLAFPVIIGARFIRHEEAALRTAFGTEAETYLASTGRWFIWF